MINHGKEIIRDLHARSLKGKLKFKLEMWWRRFVFGFSFTFFVAAGFVSAAQLTSVIKF